MVFVPLFVDDGSFDDAYPRRKESINRLERFGVGVFWTAIDAHPNHGDATTTTSALRVLYTMINIYTYIYIDRDRAARDEARSDDRVNTIH